MAYFDPTRGLRWDHFLPIVVMLSWCRAGGVLGVNTGRLSLALCWLFIAISLFLRADCALCSVG
jgi:hypothetical protein